MRKIVLPQQKYLPMTSRHVDPLSPSPESWLATQNGLAQGRRLMLCTHVKTSIKHWRLRWYWWLLYRERHDSHQTKPSSQRIMMENKRPNNQLTFRRQKSPDTWIAQRHFFKPMAEDSAIKLFKNVCERTMSTIQNLTWADDSLVHTTSVYTRRHFTAQSRHCPLFFLLRIRHGMGHVAHAWPNLRSQKVFALPIALPNTTNKTNG